MAKILVVEDEREIAEYLYKYLKREGLEVKVLNSGEHVSETVRNEHPDLILLDIMLPVKGGLSCCKEIRQFSDVPIIMLTAKISDIDRVIGLEAGADDYVCKPFNVKEVILRIKSVLKRFNISISKHGLILDKERYELRYLEKEPVKLTKLEFELMQLLYSKPSRVYSRQQIIDLAYAEERDITERAVDSHVKNLRKKIRYLDIEPEVINSVYGAGYQYIPPDN